MLKPPPGAMMTAAPVSLSARAIHRQLWRAHVAQLDDSPSGDQRVGVLGLVRFGRKRLRLARGLAGPEVEHEIRFAGRECGICEASDGKAEDAHTREEAAQGGHGVGQRRAKGRSAVHPPSQTGPAHPARTQKPNDTFSGASDHPAVGLVSALLNISVPGMCDRSRTTPGDVATDRRRRFRDHRRHYVCAAGCLSFGRAAAVDRKLAVTGTPLR